MSSGNVSTGFALRSGVALLVFVLAAEWVDPGVGGAQIPPSTAREVTAEDSVDVLASARSRQAEFERIRRRYLPLGRSSSGGRCDERIGRFCLTHEDGVDWRIPPERREVAAARADLIAELAAARSRLRGDAWINGQLVRYLTEDRRYEEAIVAAEECRSSADWCSALVGFAHHYAGRPEAAETAFAATFQLLDEAGRARWADLSMLLSGPSAAAYRRLPTADRAHFEERFWTLADPLFTRSGNELRSEHFARHVWSRLQDHAASPEGSSWSADQAEVLMRYGWPLGWERVEAVPGQLGPPPLIAHLGSSPFFLLPPEDVLLGEKPAGDWDSWNPAPRVEYEIPLQDSTATWLFPLDHQFAVFYRAGTPVLVAVYDLPSDSIPSDVKVQSALGILPFDRPAPGPEPVRRESSGGRGAHMAALPVGTAVVASLELVLPETRRLARARRSLPPYTAPDGPHLSDLLLIDSGAVLPDSLSAALSVARGSTTVLAGEEIGIFWELYGIGEASPETLDVTLRFARAGSPGILRRIAERVGLASEANPVRLEWEEPVREGSVLARAIGLRIPASAAGDYTLELTAQRLDEPPIIARRSVRVIRP